MKKILLITIVAISSILIGCGAGKDPGYSYMPDMFYSRAYETYAPTTELKDAGVNFDRMPVSGAIARETNLDFVYPFKNDSAGYAMSATVKNPLDTLGAAIDLKEAERLYLIHCAICHGSKLDGNGPLFDNGNGPYTAAPKNFKDPAVIALADGTMYHSITYGIRAMGGYASQVTPIQRWEIISYIRSKQKGTATTAAGTDSTATKTNSAASSKK